MPEDIKAKKCKNAVMAAAEIIAQEACEGGTMVSIPIGDGVLIWMPDEAIKEIGYSPHSPQTSEEVERAIESCMKSRWATNWVKAFLGPNAPTDAIEAFKKSLCEKLYRKYIPTFGL